MSKSRRPSKLVTGFVCLFALALLAGACGNDSPKAKGGGGSTGTTQPKGQDFNQAQFSGEPTIGGKMTFGVESSIASLDPGGSLAQPSDIETALGIYDHLVLYGDNGEIAPSLATKWSNTPDLKTYEITVRKDVKFGDGTPFNADAVIKQFTRLKDPATMCPCNDVVDKIQSMNLVDPYTMQFHLTEPNAFWMNTLATAIGFIASPTQVAKYGADYARHPMGTGPFILTDYDGLVLKKNPNYWKKDDKGRQLPYLDQITIKPIPDSQNRLAALKAGDVDIIQTADTANIVDAIKAGSFDIQKVKGSSSTIALFNEKREPFSDKRMRQAWAYALNREEINRIQYHGTRQPSYLPFATDSPFYNKATKPITYNLAKAKSLVAAAVADGVDPSYDAVCIPTPEARTVNGKIKEQMEAAGFKVKNSFQDQGSYVNRIFSKSGDYQTGCFRNAQCASADCLYNQLHTDASANVVFYSNKKVDAALDAVRKTTDTKEQIQLLKEVQDEISQDVPALPLLYDLYGNIYTKQVSGLAVPEPWSLGAINPTTLYIKK